LFIFPLGADILACLFLFYRGFWVFATAIFLVAFRLSNLVLFWLHLLWKVTNLILIPINKRLNHRSERVLAEQERIARFPRVNLESESGDFPR